MKHPIPVYWQNYIDGKFVDCGAGRITIENPASGEPPAEQVLADAADVKLAVSAGSRGHQSGILIDMRPS